MQIPFLRIKEHRKKYSLRVNRLLRKDVAEMTSVQEAWERMKLEYQSRYYEKYKKSKDESDTDNHGAMLEMSYVLITVFGLTSSQVEEIERNAGFTDEDINKYQRF